MITEQGSRARLREILDTNSTVTVSGIADRLGVDEENVVRLCRAVGVPMYTKAGALWVRGRKPSRPTPVWLQMEKSTNGRP